jgi:hypothetical protein
MAQNGRSLIVKRLGMVAYYAAALVAGVFLTRVIPSDGSWLFFLLLAAASLIDVTLHETGHAIAATRRGFRILAFAIWPIALLRRKQSWRFK